MFTIACVLRSGGDFYPEYVYRLRDQICKNITVPYHFVCLTDFSLSGVGVDARPFKHNLPGWWSKMNMFYLKGPILCLDLDISVVGNIDPLVEGICSLESTDTILLKAFRSNTFAGAIWGWKDDRSVIVKNFISKLSSYRFSRFNPMGKPTKFGREYLYIDDQFFPTDEPMLIDVLGRLGKIRAAQEFVKEIYSYKVHCLPRGGKYPEDAKIIIYAHEHRPVVKRTIPTTPKPETSKPIQLVSVPQKYGQHKKPPLRQNTPIEPSGPPKKKIEDPRRWGQAKRKELRKPVPIEPSGPPRKNSLPPQKFGQKIRIVLKGKEIVSGTPEIGLDIWDLKTGLQNLFPDPYGKEFNNWCRTEGIKRSPILRWHYSRRFPCRENECCSGDKFDIQVCRSSPLYLKCLLPRG